MAEETWHEYVTDKPHGGHPAGSKCLARRDRARNLVLLRFGEEVIELRGAKFYLKGIEQPHIPPSQT